MIEIRLFNTKDIEIVCQLFNKQQLPYHPWDKIYFTQKFLNNPNYCEDCSFIATLDSEVIGFGFGLYKKVFLSNEDPKKTPGFITMIVVKKNFRRQGIGRQLLKQIEKTLSEEGKKRIDCSFFNPINLNWFIPNTDKHEHPNAPGVLYPSDAYHFFLNNGYRAVALQNAYYLKLDNFTIPSEVYDRIESLQSKGISFEIFDKKKHDYGDLFDRLGNLDWKEEITNASYEENLPVLTPVYQNKAIGFTGPLYVEKSKRGYFAGIGVHPDFRQYGIGKVLFFLLCDNLKQLGATYMSLFTGDDNPARRMYENANFKIVKSFYVMRKEEKND